MCDICKAEKIDSKFINGKKYKLFSREIYSLIANRITPIKLCYVHDIEFFCNGERKFMEMHPRYTIDIIKAPPSRVSFGSIEEQLKNISQLI